MKRIYVLISIILISIIIIFIKSNNKIEDKNTEKQTLIINETTTNEINKNTIINDKTVKIISHKLNYGIIETIIKNNTGKELKEVIIKAECYDKKGNNLGIRSNGQYNVNTKDNYKITVFCDYETYRYKLKLEYK